MEPLVRRTAIVIIVADAIGYADVLFNPQHPKDVTMPHLAPGAWHTLTLQFDGINLDGEIGGAKFSATDKFSSGANVAWISSSPPAMPASAISPSYTRRQPRVREARRYRNGFGDILPNRTPSNGACQMNPAQPA